MMARAMFLFAVGQRQRTIEGVRMWARQDRERGEPLRKFVGDAPCDAAAPVMADEMKAVSPSCAAICIGSSTSLLKT
jgi:hypothetical protein